MVDFEGLCGLCHHFSTTNSNFRIHTIIEEVLPNRVDKRKPSSSSPCSELGLSDLEDYSVSDQDSFETSSEYDRRQFTRLSKIVLSPSADRSTKAHAAKKLRRILDDLQC